MCAKTTPGAGGWWIPTVATFSCAALITRTGMGISARRLASTRTARRTRSATLHRQNGKQKRLPVSKRGDSTPLALVVLPSFAGADYFISSSSALARGSARRGTISRFRNSREHPEPPSPTCSTPISPHSATSGRRGSAPRRKKPLNPRLLLRQ